VGVLDRSCVLYCKTVQSITPRTVGRSVDLLLLCHTSLIVEVCALGVRGIPLVVKLLRCMLQHRQAAVNASCDTATTPSLGRLQLKTLAVFLVLIAC
jgi:hypothetical protein